MWVKKLTYVIFFNNNNNMKHFNILTTAAMAAALSFGAFAAAPPTFRGSLISSYPNTGTFSELSTTGSETLLVSGLYSTMNAASYGGTYNNNVYYFVKNSSNISAHAFTYNTEDWTKRTEYLNLKCGQYNTSDLAYDKETDLIYGFYSKTGYTTATDTLYVVGKTTVSESGSWSRKNLQVQVGPDMKDVTYNCKDSNDIWHGIAFDSTNQLWVITYGGKLYKVDKNTGAMTLVGDTGIVATAKGSAAFDMRDNTLYWSVTSGTGDTKLSAIYKVDTTDATATKVVDIPNNYQFMGMYIGDPAAKDGAPSEPTNITYNFPEGAFSGNITFDVPGTLFDGTATSGDVSYSVVFNNGEAVTGTTTYGATGVSVAVSVEASGEYPVEIRLENSVGLSPKANYTGYIGFGEPTKPTNVVLAYEDGKMVLSWDAPTTVKDNKGYLGALKYRISKRSGNTSTVVAEDIEGTTYEEEMEEPTTGVAAYNYAVTAVNGDEESEAATSNTVSLGSYGVPYLNDFKTKEDFNSMTVLNGQTGTKTWAYSTSGYATIGYDSSYTKDDWMITPPIPMYAGEKYKVSVDVRAQRASDPENFEVAWGDDATAAAMENIILENTEITSATFETYNCQEFEVPTDGKYFVGVHACSPKNRFTFYVDNLAINKVTETGVEGVVVEAGEAAVYYNLQGVRVEKPENGVFVRVANGKAVKVVK